MTSRAHEPDYRDPPAPADADVLHERLFAGDIVRYRSLPEMEALVAFTRSFLETRCAPLHPTLIHWQDAVDVAAACSVLQRDFSRSPDAKRLWIDLFRAVGLDPGDAARDRLLLRFQPPGARPWSRSTATVGFHRDTWGSNIYAQVNWWAPVYPIDERRTFAFLPELFDRPIANTSDGYDIAAIMRRNRGEGPPVERGEMVPRPLEMPRLDDARPVTIAPGELILFASQHAHVGIGNDSDLTRISLETRTVRLADLRAGAGARNVDGRGRWVAYSLFRMIDDGRPLHERLGCEPLVPYRPAI